MQLYAVCEALPESTRLVLIDSSSPADQVRSGLLLCELSALSLQLVKRLTRNAQCVHMPASELTLEGVRQYYIGDRQAF